MLGYICVQRGKHLTTFFLDISSVSKQMMVSLWHSFLFQTAKKRPSLQACSFAQNILIFIRHREFDQTYPLSLFAHILLSIAGEPAEDMGWQ